MESHMYVSHVHIRMLVVFITEINEIYSMDLDTLLVTTFLLLTITSSCCGSIDHNCTSMYVLLYVCINNLKFMSIN